MLLPDTGELFYVFFLIINVSEMALKLHTATDSDSVYGFSVVFLSLDFFATYNTDLNHNHK